MPVVDQGAAAPSGPRPPDAPRPARGQASTQAIQAEVAIELLGAEEAPGVKEGGVLEHVTHQITIAALPTDDPRERSPSTSPAWRSATRFSSTMVAPEGVEFALGEDVDAEEVTIATLIPPRVEEEPEPELEEETELIGEDGEPIEARGGRRGRGRRRRRRRRRRLRRLRASSDCASSRCRLFGRHRGRRQTPAPADRFLVVGLGNPGLASTPRTPPQRRLRGRRRALPPLGPAEGASRSSAA